jgi:hypothetical protein
MKKETALIRILGVTGLTLCLTAVAAAQSSRPGINPVDVIYIIPSSHWDLGFKLPPEEQLDDIKPHLDGVIAAARKDPEFRWVIESSWQLQAWLDRTKDPALVEQFTQLIRSGQIQLSAVYGSEHTEFMGTEQLDRIAYQTRDIEQRLGVTTDLAMMDDVPGFNRRLPQVLSRSGVRYFVTGSNLFIGGGTSLHPGKTPFHWKSPDGSSVLTWQTGSKNGGYVEGMADYYLDPPAYYYSDPSKTPFYPKEWAGLPSLEIMKRGIAKLQDEYSKAGYPYDAALVLFSHDFIPASYEEDGLLPFVRQWNAAGNRPKLVVATPAEFFHHLEQKYGDPFPTYSGDFSGLWSEVKTNSPGITADARWIQDYLPQAETLWSLTGIRFGKPFPQAQTNDAWNKMFKYDEHSGAGQPGWPKVMSLAEVNRQNQEYSNYSKSARSETRSLMLSGVEQLGSVDPDPQNAIKCIVYNPLSWSRTELVHIRPPSENLTQVRDVATNKVMSSQLDPGGELSFIAEDVPSIGYRTYHLEAAPQTISKSTAVDSDVLENKFYTLHIRLSDGTITSLFDKQLGKELVNSGSQARMAQLVRWNYGGFLADQDWHPSVRHVRGPLTDELVITRKGTWWPATRIALDSTSKQVVIDNMFNRSLMPSVPIAKGGEFYSFAFPFNFGQSADIYVDDGIGFFEFPKDLLPGARTDAVTPIHTLSLVDMHDAPSSSISLLQREDFFDIPIRWPGKEGQPGGFLNEIRVDALRKSDQGDTRDAGVVTLPTVEPGFGPLYTSSIAVVSGHFFNPVRAWQQGWEFNVPLLVSVLPADRKPDLDAVSYFSLSVSNVTLLDIHPAYGNASGEYMIRLQEFAGQDTAFALHSAFGISSISETTMTEDKVLRTGLEAGKLKIGKYETLTLHVTVDDPENITKK